MASVLVSSLLSSLTTNLNSLLQQDSEFLRHVIKDLKFLLNSFSSMKAAVEVAESMQAKDQRISAWLTQLKEAAYIADDIIDELAFEVLRSKTEDAIAEENHTREFSFSLQSCMDTMKEIREMMNEIVSDGAMFDLGFAEKRLESDGEQWMGSVSQEFRVFGREKDTENVVELLMNGGDPFIVPIVGLGGIGKTTVARLAYDDERVERNFEIRMWFSMSEDFDLETLTKEIVDRAIGGEHWISGVYELERCLREKLGGKRFLIVLDGVWSGDRRKWNRLRNLLACGAKGSKIIVTARTEVMASIMDMTVPYLLEHLSDDDCWALFKYEVFGVESLEEFPNLAAIGEEIVKKCRGVPLAVKAVGSILRFRREEIEWLVIKDSEIWNLPEDEGIFLPALILSYNRLPLHSKECFAYCCVFPRGHEIEKEKLIQLWMANGFIPSRGTMELEDIGHEMFVELLSRSFFQATEKDEDGHVEKYKLHDAAYDLARSVMGAECMKADAEEAPKFSPARIRHLSSSDVTSAEKALESLHKAQKLHSFLLLSNYDETTSLCRRLLFPHYISEFRFLRVLDLRHTDIKILQIPMDNLKHLRYLDLSYSNIEALPESISSLRNLQTLKLRGCAMLHQLPKNMKDMVKLRHLDISECWSLSHLPKNIGQLTCLQSLTAFIVGQESGCGIEELQHLNLGGVLRITKVGNVRNSTKAREATLIAKQNLLSLEVCCQECRNVVARGNFEEVLEGLEPHPNLKRLDISYYSGIKFPRWMMDSTLTNLEKISLFVSEECEIEFLPPFGQLPFLKVLVIANMNGLKCIGAVFYGTSSSKAFPSLKELTLRGMANLEEWSGFEGREAFPSLRKLTIDGCPKLSTLPWLPSLEELDIRDSNGKVLRSVMKFTSLSSLCLDEFPETVSLPEGLLRNLTHLKSLTISRFPELTSLPDEMKNLTSLESLSIYACMNLISLPDDWPWQGLTCLRLLSIWYCRNMPSLPEGLQYLTSLRTLDIYGCDKLASLPVGLRQITTLQDLRIGECDVLTSSLPEWLPHVNNLQDLSIVRSPSLMSLPESIRNLTSLKCINIQELDNLTCLPDSMRHLTGLQTLQIARCPKLSSLPEWVQDLTLLCHLLIWSCPAITSLPAAVQHLNALEYLSIGDCPHLERRCQKGTGEDWHKVAHVPRIIIKGRYDN
ncbi:putative disease resistance protein RGA1 [Magnolia sinica]|uniref:putative disease resistance protein RGA1 n=1 Tax=Magnolia sinica TaxID=86752 RepID=UPI0026580E47|nr:putative disease resistance protein RGA1 [Magnolia sinica]XP_058107192.1 putative disease resistance protein RGA1 [Magnolia sinica]